MPLIDQVRATIRRHHLLPRGARLMVALSGGSDSVALTHLCHELHGIGDIVLAGAAHLNHRLRAEAGDDAAFCVRVAASLQIPIESGAVDVGALAAERGVSIETAAHDARYAFLQSAATRLGAEFIALGHTLDDQAETVLLRLLRGAGSRGLAAMYPKRGRFVRPLIGTRREALRDFLRERGLDFRDDASNGDRAIPRNRIRADLLPWLAREFNPRIVEVLGQQAEISRDEWDWLNSAAEDLLRMGRRGNAPEWVCPVLPWQGAHPAVARTALRSAMERASGGRPISWVHVNRALALFAPGTGGGADFPGQRLQRLGDAVVITSGVRIRPARHEPATGEAEPAGFLYPLTIPGEAAIPEAGATVTAEIGEPGQPVPASGPACAVVRFDPSSGRGWAVRSRRPGDRVSLPGMGGHKKLQDLFVDRKVPRDRRDRVPLVVDEHDRLVWVGGHVVAGEFRVTDPAQAMLILRLKLWGGSA